MPDPQRDIASIIEPVAPPMPLEGPGFILPLLLGAVVLLLVALAWYWYKRSPLRMLRKIQQEPDPVKAAARLAVLVKNQDKIPPADWQSKLERLRFGPPVEDASSTFARLCMEAETLFKSR